MKKTLLLTALLLAVAVPAMAAGLNIAWGTDCYTTNPVVNENFFCNKNTGSHTMWLSFVPSVAQPEFVGIEVYLEGMSSTPAVPDWWMINTNITGCRTGAMTADANFLSAPQVDCVDTWSGTAAGGLAGYFTNGARMSVVIGYAVAAPIPLDPDVEYYACKVFVTNTKTILTGACAGCLTPVIWGLNKLKAAELTQFEMHETPIPGGNQCLTWQGGGGLVCGPPIPVKNSTWGQIKSLYR